METGTFKGILAQMQKTLECAICLELLNNPVSTKCDHQFCRFCITKFLQNKRYVPCPLCKSAITKRGLQERTELSNVVQNVKKLITAFEADTGEKYTPSKGSDAAFISTPQDIKPKTRERRRKVPEDAIENKVLKTGCVEGDRLSDVFCRGSPNTRSKSSSSTFSSPKQPDKQETIISAAEKEKLKATPTRCNTFEDGGNEISKTSKSALLDAEENELQKFLVEGLKTAKATKSSRKRLTENSSGFDNNLFNLQDVDSNGETSKSPNRHHEKEMSPLISSKCREQYRVRGSSGNKRNVRRSNDELLKYLEEGSCGAALDTLSTDDGKHIVEVDFSRQMSKKTDKVVAAADREVDEAEKCQLERKKIEVRGTDSGPQTRRSSRGRLPLYPEKAKVDVVNMAPVESSKTVENNECLKNNTSLTVESKKLFPAAPKDDNESNINEVASTPSSEVSSLSSTQELMKPKPVVSRTYSKEMQAVFRAEGGTRNWAVTLPSTKTEDFTINDKNFKGMITKEKILAKKAKTEMKLQPGNDLLNIPTSSHESKISKEIDNNTVSKTSAPQESQFEFPLTPIPIKRSIFKSRQPKKNDKEEEVDIEKKVTDEGDPYQFVVGHTPVKTKKKITSDRNSSKKESQQRGRKQKSMEASKLPLEIISSHTNIEKVDSTVSAASVDCQTIHEVLPKELEKGKGKNVRFALDASIDVQTDSGNDIQETDKKDKSLPGQKSAFAMGGLESSQFNNDFCLDANQIPSENTLDQIQTTLNVATLSPAVVKTGRKFNEERCVKGEEKAKSASLEHEILKKQGAACPSTENLMNVSLADKSNDYIRAEQGTESKRTQQEMDNCDTMSNQSDRSRTRKASVRRKNKRPKVSDSEILSQRSDREMNKLILKINEAEDYEFMFNTQEAQKKMQEEQTNELQEEQGNEKKIADAFGFEMPDVDGANDSRIQTQKTRGTEIVTKDKKVSPSKSMSNSEVGDQSVTLDMSGPVSPLSFSKKSNSQQCGKCDSKMPSKNEEELNNFTMQDIKEGTKPLILNTPSGEKCDAVLKGSERDVLSEEKNKILPTYRSRKSRAINFPRPNFSAMIQVSPGPKGVVPLCQTPNRPNPVGIVMETPVIENSSLNRDKTMTSESCASFESPCSSIIPASVVTKASAKDGDHKKHFPSITQLSLKSKDFRELPDIEPNESANDFLNNQSDQLENKRTLFANTCNNSEQERRYSSEEHVRNETATVDPETMEVDPTLEGCLETGDKKTNAPCIKESELEPDGSSEITRQNLPMSDSNTAHQVEVVSETQLNPSRPSQTPDGLKLLFSPQCAKLGSHVKNTCQSSKETHVSTNTEIQGAVKSQQIKAGEETSQVTLSGSSLPSQSILQRSSTRIKIQTKSYPQKGESNFKENGGKVDSSETVCMKLPSDSEPSVLISGYEVNNVENGERMSQFCAKTEQTPNSGALEVNDSAQSRFDSPRSTRLSRKRKCAGDNLSYSSPSKSKQGTILKTPPSCKVNSAPCFVDVTDSDDEDSVLLVRRSKRKCLSLDDTPLKPIVFGNSAAADHKKEEQASIPETEVMIGESEALDVIETLTKYDVDSVNGMNNSISEDGFANDPKFHQTSSELHTTFCNTEAEQLQNCDKVLSSPSFSETMLTPPSHTTSLVQVTPVGKLKCIDTSGTYVLDMDDMEPQSQTEGTHNVLSQRQLFKDTSETNLTRSSVQKEISTTKQTKNCPFDAQKSVSGDCVLIASGKKNDSSENADTNVALVITDDKADGSETVDDTKNHSCSYESNSNVIGVEKDEVGPKSSENLSSGKMRKTRRGLASRKSALNTGPFPKHPKAILSPKAKAAIIGSNKKPFFADKTEDLVVNSCNTEGVGETENTDDKENCEQNSGTEDLEMELQCHGPENITESDDGNDKFEKLERAKHNQNMKLSGPELQKQRPSLSKEEIQAKRRLEMELFPQECTRKRDGRAQSDRTNKKVEKKTQSHCSTVEKRANEEDTMSFDLDLESESENEETVADVGIKRSQTNTSTPSSPLRASINDGNTSQTKAQLKRCLDHKSRVIENDDELSEDVNSSNSMPLTSSPLKEKICDEVQASPDQSLIIVVGESDDEEEDNICTRPNKKIKRQQIASDSEESEQEDNQAHSPTNYTSSSVFSSQSETLTTQQQEALEGDLAQLHKEIAKYEAKLGSQNADVSHSQTHENDGSKKDHQGWTDKTVNDVFVISESPATVSTTADDDDEDDEDSNDLFVSPLSPSPPSRSTKVKAVARKPALSDSARLADQFQKQFQSPGGTVRVKKSLEFTMSKPSPHNPLEENKNLSHTKPSVESLSTRLLPENLTKEEVEISEVTSKGNPTKMVSQSKIGDRGVRPEEEDIDRPISPVILSQKSRQSQASQPVGRKDGTGRAACETKNTLSHPEKELCFVASGLGRDENLMVLRLVEKHGAKFCSKFTKDVTHVIMKPVPGYELVCERTLKFFQGVAHKCWIVAFPWLTNSLRTGQLLPEVDFEIQGDTSGGETANGPKRSRLSEEFLFSEFCFACVGTSEEMPKGTLCDLLTSCGADTVDDPMALLSKSAKYKLIVRCSNTDEEPTPVELDMLNGLYKYTGILTVMREWVLDSLGSYTLLPLEEYILNTCDKIRLPF